MVDSFDQASYTSILIWLESYYLQSGENMDGVSRWLLGI